MDPGFFRNSIPDGYIPELSCRTLLGTHSYKKKGKISMSANNYKTDIFYQSVLINPNFEKKHYLIKVLITFAMIR